MSQNGDGDRLAAVLRANELTQCPHCQAPLTSARVTVGWNTEADPPTPRGPIVWMTCTPCGQEIKRAYLPYFAESLDDALEALEEG